ncbi:MAG: hypothetical protein LBJ36_11530 [Synergistaceae bacterium]|jgi:hypothetical protein|nr:hypothetical protein [Synergistaceae bacterium]
MRVGAIVGVPDDRAVSTVGYDFAEKYAQRRESLATSEVVDQAGDDALRKVEEAQKSNDRTRLQMMDRHNEMVKKSQELNKVKAKQQAIQRQDKEHREEQRELLAEMALRNAERRDLLGAARLKD